jgi:hypothetical protein
MRMVLSCCAVLVTVFPDPQRLSVQVGRYLAGPGSLVAPDDPALEPLKETYQQLIASGATPQKAVRKAVSAHVRYASDFTVWGQLDYWPTVSETLAKGREDCDGIAIVTASLARQVGLKQCRLRARPDHMWVEFKADPDDCESAAEPETPVLIAAARDLKPRDLLSFVQHLEHELSLVRRVLLGLLLAMIWTLPLPPVISGGRSVGW